MTLGEAATAIAVTSDAGGQAFEATAHWAPRELVLFACIVLAGMLVSVSGAFIVFFLRTLGNRIGTLESITDGIGKALGVIHDDNIMIKAQLKDHSKEFASIHRAKR